MDLRATPNRHFLEVSVKLKGAGGSEGRKFAFSGSECQSKGGRAESLQFSGSECQSKGGRARGRLGLRPNSELGRVGSRILGLLDS